LLSVLLDIMLWLQPEATGVHNGGGPGGAPAHGPGGCGGGPDFGMFLLLGTFAFMYFLVVAPQRKQQKKHDAMLKALTKGDVVRTDSGIRGEILSLTDREAVLLVDAKTKINILRSRIAGPDAPEGAKGEKPEKSKDEGEKKEKEG
jgi:preprotein translocase subunit YajC